MTFLKSIELTNFLSFGPNSSQLEFGKLNIIIGPNGSGKSNLLEAIDLIRSAPTDIAATIRRGGGVGDWLWKGSIDPVATIDAVFSGQSISTALRYVMSFSEVGQRFELRDERIERERANSSEKSPYFFYRFDNGRGVLNLKNQQPRRLAREDIDPSLSILAQRKDPDQYPEITYLGDAFGKIKLYREWSFGRSSAPRLPQKADGPNEYLLPDATNLGLVLSRLRRDLQSKNRLLIALKELYADIDDFDVHTESGTVQVFINEGKFTVPATRLSDGTLRYLSLLAVLCDPKPPQLICIEEPELGLHPDIIPTVARLLLDASEKCQIIVTTHSDLLVDAMSDFPEAVVVTEKSIDGTSTKRLSASTLKPWLESYRLGELWTRGEIGGNRW
jgi:predicted ATPase